MDVTHPRVRDLVATATTSPGHSGRVLLTTIFGDALVPRRQEIAVGTLATLSAPFGLNERLVRTSLQRLATDGVVASERRGRRSFYRVADDALPTFERANARIYLPPTTDEPWDGSWTIAVLSPPATDAARRIRSELGWLGMSAVAPDVYASPTIDPGAVATVIEAVVGHGDHGGTGGEVVSLTRGSLHAGTMGDADHRAQHLDPDGRLREMLDRHRSWFEPVESTASDLEPADAFTARTLLIDSWRRIALATPSFPAEFVPDSWPATELYELTARMHRSCYDASERHLDSLAGTPQVLNGSLFDLAA